MATSLVKEFPQYPDVVVSVARKTDAQLWPLLFNTVGRPSEILDVLLNQGLIQHPNNQLPAVAFLGSSHSAACLLVVIEKMEGSVLSRALSLQVLQVALTSGEYDLVAELLRYAIAQSDFNLLFTKETSSSELNEEPESSIGSWFAWMWGNETIQNSLIPARDNRPVVLSGASFEAAKVCFIRIRSCEIIRWCESMYGVYWNSDN